MLGDGSMLLRRGCSLDWLTFDGIWKLRSGVLGLIRIIGRLRMRLNEAGFLPLVGVIGSLCWRLDETGC
jgi:hypothetical protein